MTPEEMVMEHRGRPSMTPDAIARRKAAYAANWLFLPDSNPLVVTRFMGRTTIPQPTQKLKDWKASPKRFGIVKYEPGYRMHQAACGMKVRTRQIGLYVRFESLGDKVAFEDDFNV